MSDAVSRTEGLGAEAAQRASPGATTLRRIAERRTSVVGLVGVVIIVGLAVLAPAIAPHDPVSQDLTAILLPPAWGDGGTMDHLLGTDALGRDVASRLLFGARNSLAISLAAMLIGSTLGLTAGVTAGFFGGRTDSIIMRLGDVQLAFPFILLAIAILGTIPDRTTVHLIVVLGIPGWIVYARVVRSRVLAEREKEYVTAAQAIGAKPLRILGFYVLRSVWQVVPVIALLDLGFLIIMESTLSFLGLGLPPPAASWGSMLADGRENMIASAWLPILPGLAIMATILSLNLAADGMADLLDPKLTKGTFRRLVLNGRRATPEQEGELPLLRVRDLHVDFPLRHRTVRAVRGVGFELPRRRTLGIVGESGSGKSVTALSIMQLLDAPGRVTQGQILFEGRDITSVGDREVDALRGRRIGMIFQNPAASLNPVLSIGFQMVEAIGRHRQLPNEEKRNLARSSLASVGIGNPDRVLDQYPFELSGGMNQRVMIAMAMTAQPDLLIADEPTTALDVTTQDQILRELGEVTRQHDTSLILITHDIALVAEHADTVLVMYAGQVAEIGPVDQVIHDPKHPYTRALLDSVPRPDLAAGTRLEAIPGELPDPAVVPAGCPFAPRCPEVMDVCWETNPDRFEVGPSHRAACYLWEPKRVQTAEG